MENNDFLDSGINPTNDALSTVDKNYLDTAGKWARFLGIVGFVFTGIIILGGFAMMAFGTAMTMNSEIGIGGAFGPMLGIIYLIFAAPYFFMSLYSYRFGKKIKEGLYSSNSSTVTEGFKNLKNLFQLMGILTAILIGLYVLIIVFGIGSAALLGSRM